MEKPVTTSQAEAAALWIRTASGIRYPSLEEPVSVDVAIIGAGIVGLTTATLLKRSGARIAVLEAGEVARGVSGHTTAKITSAHGLVYRQLLDRFGEEKARQYADANQAAIEFIAATVREHNIECEFKRTFACTYSPEAGDREKIEEEVKAAAGLGLPVSYLETAPVPVTVQAAIRYENQACFHPRKYLLALAAGIPESGSHLFEHSRVREVKEGSPCTVLTDRGEIKADQVVVATHFPILNRGLYFAKMVPRRAYVLAFRVEENAPEGMFYSMAPPYHTFRKHVTETGETFMLVGGEDHPTGKVTDTLECYRRLEEFARKNFRLPSEFFRWSTQDNDPMDGVPFIGRHSFFSKKVFVATGFGGWGMTNGTAAGMILADQISGRANSWSPVFDPVRTTSYRSKKFVARNIGVSGTYIMDYLPKPGQKSIDDLARGEAGIVKNNKEEVAAYKDENDRLHAVSPRCTHLYCKVQWNNAEKSWDCPCHGSRFSYDGKVLHAPATGNLKEK